MSCLLYPPFPLLIMPSKCRDYCFTINNPTAEDLEALVVLGGLARYLIWGEETGDSGTLHYQGFVMFPNARSLQSVKSLLPRAHLEKRRGTVTQAINYCKKDGIITELGHAPLIKKTSKERWTEIVKLAEQGDLDAIKTEYPKEYIHYYTRLRSLCHQPPIILDTLIHEWWYGPTGTGKSRTLWQKYPEHYQKECNKWWCGYQYQPVVAIEEWSPKNECTASYLKIWADRYPFTAQIKGGSLTKVRPAKIIVLSNYTIDQCFPNPEDSGPLKRRFKVVHFPFPCDAAFSCISPTSSDLASYIMPEVNIPSP